MTNVTVFLALGRIAFDECLRLYAARGGCHRRAAEPAFAHGAVQPLSNRTKTLVAEVPPSQQNTLTGRLTPR